MATAGSIIKCMVTIYRFCPGISLNSQQKNIFGGIMRMFIYHRVKEQIQEKEVMVMESFDSTKRSLFEILKDVHNGKIQLPDFQRGWVWDDNRIKGILASVAKSFPIGAIMLLETGNENVRFKTKPVEGVNSEW